jgi:hypothetical protein
MPAIVTHDMKRFLADQIIESVSEPAASVLYLAIGKIGAWANDAAPDTPIDTIDEHNGIWNQMHFAKRLTTSDISLVCRRINWTANTVYDQYRNDLDLTTLNYYVLTSDFNIYKCLENNQGAPSTIEPTYSSINTTNRTADGYLWKYMYSLSRVQRIKFLTDDWMPVRELTLNDGSTQYGVQTSAGDGTIEAIQVITGGSGYGNPSVNTTITIGGDGTGARANVVANTTTNAIMYISVTSRGSGYTWANVNITSSNTLIANGATARAVISPYGGHGSNPPSELDARGLILNVRIRGDENQTLKVGNDFRQIALIVDPELRSTGNVASNSVINQTMTLTLSGSGGPYANDEWVFQGASLEAARFKGQVVWFEDNVMQLSNTSGTIRSSTIIGANSSASRFVGGYEDTVLSPRTGKVLYIDNRAPITRSNNQTENIQIPLIF